MVELPELKNTERFKNKLKEYYKQVFLRSIWQLVYIWIGWIIWVGLILFGYIPIPEDWHVSFYFLYSIPVIFWIISKFCLPFKVCKIQVSNKRSSLKKDTESQYQYFVFENGTRYEVENIAIYNKISIDKFYTFVMRGKYIIDIFEE